MCQDWDWRTNGYSQNLATENGVRCEYQKCSPSNSKQPPKNICAELLQCSKKEGDAFLPRIITGDGTWVHHYNTMMKR
jgi:hypothetical protein